MVWVYAREIVEERDVSAAVDIYRVRFPRFEDAYAALQWRLARRGDIMGFHARGGKGGYRLYRQGGDPVAQTPSLIVVYTVSPDQIVIVGLTAEAYGAGP
jgi:hypothetical protein